MQLDVTVVNVALPTIGADPGTSVSGLQWVVDGHAVPFASLLLAGGALGDRYGHRRLVLWGLAIFGLGSAVRGFVPTAGVLIAARAVQGVGAAARLPATLAVITHAYPEKTERAKAIGIWAAVAGLSLPLGPLLGGLLVAGPGWRRVFLINLPIIAAALYPVLRTVPPSRGATARRLDIPGTLLGALTLTGCTPTLIEGGVSAGAWPSSPTPPPSPPACTTSQQPAPPSTSSQPPRPHDGSPPTRNTPDGPDRLAPPTPGFGTGHASPLPRLGFSTRQSESGYEGADRGGDFQGAFLVGEVAGVGDDGERAAGECGELLRNVHRDSGVE